jgi:hypothetical protein
MFLYNASKYSRYTKISCSIERIIYRNDFRGLKTTCKFWIARSKQQNVCNVFNVLNVWVQSSDCSAEELQFEEII